MPDWLSVCVVISLLFSAITAYILYSGLLSDITILTGCPPIKKITFAYKFKEGSYKNCGQLFKESHSIGPKLSCIGVFYDDPKKVNYHPTLSVEQPLILSVFLRTLLNIFSLDIRKDSKGYVVDR